MAGLLHDDSDEIHDVPDTRAGGLARPATELTLLSVEQMPAGHIVNARAVLSQLEDYVIALRHDADRRARGKETDGSLPFYRCQECETPLLIRSDKRDYGHAYYFKHPHNSPDCSLKRDDETPIREEINAARYKGLPEGARHIRLKNLIRSSVAADPSFQQIQKEHRINDREDATRYRTPDVSFLSQGVRVAVEAQVSNTSLDIMLDRQDFYARHDSLLLWVVDVEPEGDIRMYLKDVRAVHRGNIFVVDEKSLAASFVQHQFMLWCYFFVPVLNKAGAIEDLASKQLVSFTELKRDVGHAEMWFYDRPAALLSVEAVVTEKAVERKRAADDRRRREAVMESAPVAPPPVAKTDNFLALREEYCQGIERSQYEPRHLLVDYMFDRIGGQHEWYTLQDRLAFVKTRMKTSGIDIPLFAEPDHFEFLRKMAILLSARFRRPIDYKHKTLVALAHFVVAQYPDVFWCFRHICLEYGGADVMRMEDANRKWAKKEAWVEHVWAADKAAGVRPRFAPDPYWRRLSAVLFPEVELFRMKRPE